MAFFTNEDVWKKDEDSEVVYITNEQGFQLKCSVTDLDQAINRVIEKEEQRKREEQRKTTPNNADQIKKRAKAPRRKKPQSRLLTKKSKDARIHLTFTDNDDE